MTLSIYVASSWRNERYPEVVAALRAAGHEVYDWRAEGQAFAWSSIDPDWQRWTPQQFREQLSHPLAREGFARDAHGMWRSQVCVLLLPCGRSAHLEAGWFWGQERHVLILLAEGQEPELMYRGPKVDGGGIYLSLDELVADLGRIEAGAEPRCHRCGCTEFDPCEDGCWWVHQDPWLCSRCDSKHRDEERDEEPPPPFLVLEDSCGGGEFFPVGSTVQFVRRTP